MQNTSQQYDAVVKQCRDLFTKKMSDYGSAWRILRLPSLTDQIFIKIINWSIMIKNKSKLSLHVGNLHSKLSQCFWRAYVLKTVKKKNAHINIFSYPPSIISSTTRNTPSMLSSKHLRSTFFLQIRNKSISHIHNRLHPDEYHYVFTSSSVFF